MKLKLIENLTGLGNSDAGVIKSMAQSMFSADEKEVVDISGYSEDDIDYPKFTSNKMEEYEDYFVYDVNGEKKIGIKID